LKEEEEYWGQRATSFRDSEDVPDYHKYKAHVYMCGCTRRMCAGASNGIIVLESLQQIPQESSNTRLFMTGRPQVLGEVEKKFHGAATFIPIRPTEDGVVRYLRDELQNDTTPEIMSSTLEAEIMKTIPEMDSETYVETGVRKGLR